MTLLKAVALNVLGYSVLFGLVDLLLPLPAWVYSPLAWFLLGVGIAASVIYQRERLSRRGTKAPGLPPPQS